MSRESKLLGKHMLKRLGCLPSIGRDLKDLLQEFGGDHQTVADRLRYNDNFEMLVELRDRQIVDLTKRIDELMKQDGIYPGEAEFEELRRDAERYFESWAENDIETWRPLSARAAEIVDAFVKMHSEIKFAGAAKDELFSMAEEALNGGL